MSILYIISDILSVITIGMSLISKVPQIISIYKLQSAQGINLLSLLLEISSYTVTASYNYVNKYSLLSYMEYPILIFQEYILIYAVLFYSNKLDRKSWMFAGLYFIITWGFLSEIISIKVLSFIVPMCTPVSLSSKGIQLWQILSTRNADSVSITTWIISAASNASRIYTIILDSADAILLTNFILSTLMSSTIALSTYILQKEKLKSS